MIILLFGQPGAGKTTLAEALKDRIRSNAVADSGVLTIDGDRWREVTRNQDYSREGRIRNLRGAFDMALYLEREGHPVLLSFVTPYAELRTYLRQHAAAYMEVYLTYSGDRGRNGYFVADFEEPAPDVLRLDTGRLSVEDCVSTILSRLATP
jgi:adenylylsulfate kinase-like enzyme